MNCSTFVEHLCAYLDGEASVELVQHLQHCRTCRQLAESCQTTIRFYRAEPAPELPAAIHRRVMDHLGRRMPPSGRDTHPSK